MEIKTIRVKTFDVNELNEIAKNKVMDHYRDINVSDSYWYKDTIEEIKEELESQGFIGPDIQFSGFYSQGDGLSFTASIDLAKFLAGRRIKTKYQKLIDEEVTFSIIRNTWQYVHEYTVSIDYDTPGDASDRVYELTEELANFIIDEARELMRKYYKHLQNEYEALTEDEAVIDTLQANNFRFTEDGSNTIII